jgi:hypothetical protein
MTLDVRARPGVVATVKVPIRDGAFQAPTFVMQPQPSRPYFDFGRTGGSLPLSQREQVGKHATTRTLIELAALFESEPIDGVTNRRVTHFADSSGDVHLRIDAVRVSRTLRDTVVNGRPARMVRDSTSLTVSHAYAVPARFVDRVTRTSEVVRGTITGVRLVDAESHRAFVMHDTLVLRGTMESDDGLGGRIRGPLFIRTIRESTLRDSVWQAAYPREPFDMVRYDGASRSLAASDTGSVLALLSGEAASARRALSADDYRLIRRALGDASTAFRTGVDRELMVVNLIDALLSRPPVLASSPLRRDEAAACTVDACRAMASDAAARGNVFLQAVGLVAAMVTSPRQWTDSVIKYSTTNPFLNGRALWFARGTASTAVASAKAPIPNPDAPHDAWMYWLRGEDSAYVRVRDADTAMRRIAANMNRPRSLQVDDHAASAIRFAEARTGRDYAAAFRRGRETATADSTRALYSTLLIALNDPVYSPAEMVRIMLAPQSPERDAVRAQLADLGRRGAPLPRASDSVASIIGRHVVNMVFADSVVTMTGRDARATNWFNVPKTVDTLPRFILMDSLPAAVRARAAELGFDPVARDWRLTPGAAGYLIRIDPIRQQGPFVLVSVTSTTLYSRSAGRSGGYARGFTLLFAQGPAGWVVVHASAWVT